MLECAKKHEDKLKQLFIDIAFDPFYQFEQYSVFRETFKLPEDTWNANHFVSVLNNEVIGMVSYQIKRIENAVSNLHIVHFGGRAAQNNYTFGKDAITAIRDIFEKFSFSKISFSVVIGNQAEKTYDRMVKRYNGCIVGIKKQEVKLLDGKLYDKKMYEILADDYFSQKNRRGKT